MGQKIHPKGLRLGIVKTWDARWFVRKGYSDLLKEDIQLRKFVKEKMYQAGISRVEIERTQNRIRVIIYAAKPGLVIGRSGAGVDRLKEELELLVNRMEPGSDSSKKKSEKEKAVKKQVQVSVQEVINPEMDPQLVAENIARQLERRIAYRRALKQAVLRAMRAGAKGIKVECAGRLGGGEIARRQAYLEGSVPLHTLRADIDYGLAEAFTTYGQIGVKCWIYKGDIFTDRKKARAKPQQEIALPVMPVSEQPLASPQGTPEPAAVPALSEGAVPETYEIQAPEKSDAGIEGEGAVPQGAQEVEEGEKTENSGA